MTTTRQGLDMRYGRQGGRIVPFRQPDTTDTVCSVCGRQTLSGLDYHAECRPDPDQLVLL